MQVDDIAVAIACDGAGFRLLVPPLVAPLVIFLPQQHYYTSARCTDDIQVVLVFDARTYGVQAPRRR